MQLFLKEFHEVVIEEFKNKGAPKIGNGVFIGANAAVIGNCNIGDDCFIVPNSYINFDVPPNSIVIGNPVEIIQSKDATSNYRDNFIK